jgi:transcriptional regulator with XRE-family HTH domain
VKKASPTKSGRLAGKLKKIRLELGLSQNEMLGRLGFSEHLFRSNISQYERGDRVPSPLVLLEYARLANVDLAVLIDDALEFTGAKSKPRKNKPGGRLTKPKKKR